MIRIALFSDVHGNLTALDAVLADIDRQSVDEIIFAGDLCLAGARPAACVDRLRRRHIRGVYGNTEVWLLGRRPEEMTAPESLQELITWTREQLTSADKQWLGSLPFSLSFNPTPDPAGGLQIVHANPVDVMQVLYPPEVVQAAQPEGLRQTDAAAQQLVTGVAAAILAFGHLHYPSLRALNGLLLANISSVSLPADGDSRAKYAICQWDADNGWQIAHQLVEYDLAAEKAMLAQIQPPNWEYLADSL